MKSQRDSANNPVYLPLNQETATAFDKTLQSLRDLACKALFALQIDIRCGVVHMLARTMYGPYPQPATGNNNAEPTTPTPNANTTWWHILTNQPTAASPTVLELNSDLIAFDTNVSSYLAANERAFITSGLAHFIDHCFVSSTRHIGAMNSHGALRLQLDILVLQQNLKNIILPTTTPKSSDETDESNPPSPSQNQNQQNPPDPISLPRSAKFLDWFLSGAEAALSHAQAEKETLAPGGGGSFNYDELRVLIELCFSDTLRGPRGAESREEFMGAKKASADALLRLNEIMWDSK